MLFSMTYIKRLVIQGFKSFAKKTEINFDDGINVIVGPNGAGKSNVSDALCFVLGRLSIKSIRAAKAKNLLFMGSKYVKPAKEASVELVFDNTAKTFSIDSPEVIIKRIVRYNGQSIYKINDEVKTRADIIETLALAGIDPHGFNLILQGQIQSIVRMHSEDRRKIIEEVAGIAIYESRKEKSLHELEKTDEKLKEISTTLRARSIFLKNLEKERASALRYKELETTIRRAKASILSKKSDLKSKEMFSITNSIGEKEEEKRKIKDSIEIKQKETDSFAEKVDQINKYVQKATGLEQDALHSQIASLKAELEGLRVRKENYENRKSEIETRIEQIDKSIPEYEKEINDLKTKSPLMAKKQEEIRKKKEELAKLEDERKKLISFKNELNSIKDKSKDKERQLARVLAESEQVLKQIEEYSINLLHKNEENCIKTVKNLKLELETKEKSLDNLAKESLESEKLASISESEIKNHEKVKEKLKELDICPLCQSKITEEHINHVFSDANSKIESAKEILEKSVNTIKKILDNKKNILAEINSIEIQIGSNENETVKHRLIHDKKEYLRRIIEDEHALKAEIKAIEERRDFLDKKIIELSRADENYETKMLEIEEISSRTEENVDTTIMFKEREIEGMRGVIKRSSEDLAEISLDIQEISEKLDSKTALLEKKNEEEKELNEKFQKMFKERDGLQTSIQENNLTLANKQNEVRALEDQVNYLMIGKAKMDAEKEALEMETRDFVGIELLQGSIQHLEERLQKSQESMQLIGSINMRALEVYEEVQKEYDIVQGKVNVLSKEKEDIMKIIEEIDNKKRRAFMKTFRDMNELFTENFARLYSKGRASLELENQEDIFAGGVNIVIKLAKGKYFDVTSLSGGEQSLVALSLLFAIQEYKPYHFYIFDEIDAALDKRNSERLAGLLNHYMKSGQYIVITHNDALITNSNVLYGVSMHEGISKILSLKIKETQVQEQAQPAKQVEESVGEVKEENVVISPEIENVNQSHEVGEIKQSDDSLA